MRLALALAREAGEAGDVPVGCVIAGPDGTVLGRGRNRREGGAGAAADATAHAEILAIREACAVLGTWRLDGCTLYVTLEPCPMCAGAILNAQIPRVVYGARDEKAGACGSLVNILRLPGCRQPEMEGGVLADECSKLLRDFFRQLRESRKKTTEA